MMKPKQGLTSDEIIDIAEQRGAFFVSPHYGQDTLRRKCNRLVTKGMLRRSHWKKHGRYGDWYLPTNTKNTK